ncbi:RNA-binding protein [Sphingomicrobium nitratireducens]|uniref:RNA-binding protein n=1 Tax=Sphingomicrobium nitratireducens TaxID=2964666 RepID=UPI00223F997E|nr:RNA-binding protein [Sphingomicrobium nitratireducens]
MGTNDRLADTDPTRTCILSREAAPKACLVRLVLGPDGQVHPDVRAKAPGRGAYLGVAKAVLEEAIAKGKLKGALARAFKQPVGVPDDLADRIEQALAKNALDRMGLEARGGTLVNGAEKVETACRSGKARLLLHASDASEGGRRKLDAAWRVGGGEAFGRDRGLVLPVDRTILSMALGRENVVHAALTDAAAAGRVLDALSRWQAFLEPDAGLDGGNPAAAEASAHDGRDEG